MFLIKNTLEKSGSVAITTLGGLLSATLVLLPITFPSLIVFAYFSPLPLFLLGLSLGFRSVLRAGGLATACVFLFQGPILTAEFFLFSFLGPGFLVHRALVNWKKKSAEIVWYPLSFLVRDLTLLAGIIMVVALGIYLYLIQGENIPIIAKNFVNLLDPQGQIKGIEDLIIKIFPFLPGFFTFSWMIMMLFNGAIAQGFLTRFKANLRPTPGFKPVQVPKSFLLVLGLSLLLSVIGVGTLELLGKNAALTLAFPFFLGGLAMVHYFLQRTTFAKIGLVIFYCTLILFSWLALFVVFLGILRPWLEKSANTN